ncbi:MAG: HAMP domain-containing protein [Cytophagaceae bacterium]|nr:HAMP domain-containing protein [Gemmatimonadaceae bacterium]
MSSIRTRLANRFAVLVLAAVAIFAGTVYTARRTGAYTELERHGIQRAEMALQLFKQAGASQFTVGQGVSAPTGFLQRALDAIPGYLVVYAQDSTREYQGPSIKALSAFYQGEEITELARADLETFDAYVREARTRQTSVRFAIRNDAGVLVAVRDSSGRVAVSGVSDQEANTSWREILGSALVALPFIVLIAVVGAYLLAGNVLEPVDRIRQEVEAITDGRSLHKRVAVEGDDEMSRLTTTLNAMIGRLETSFGGLRRFTADASHELKTPLAVLRADVERAMSAPPHSTEQLVALEEALQETARMTALVDSLLTLARADEGRFDLFREPVDVRSIAQEVFETALILGEPAEVNVHMPEVEDITVQGDRMRLRQLFMNLAENAIKYTPKGGAVVLSLRRDGDVALFAVRDSGIGISAADLPHIFERFWRADRARSRVAERSGNGLGLAICQWIAQAHGGTLTVQSRLHRGSTFTAAIPVAAAVVEQDPEPPSIERAAPAIVS